MAGFLAWLSGCVSPDPTAKMIAHVDAMPPEERPAEWDRTRALMVRTAPKVGMPAPDFTLKRMNEDEIVTLSTYRPGEPKFLVFASYT